jgi:hypothetical protein
MKGVIAALFLSVTLISCGGYTSGTIQKAEKGFLKFSGNKEAIMISVDDGAPFPYDLKIDAYEVKPGRHTIKIFRNNQIIVDRTIVVDNQTTFEIELP